MNKELEIVEKKTIVDLIKELKYLDDEILTKASNIKPDIESLTNEVKNVSAILLSTAKELKLTHNKDSWLELQVNTLKEELVSLVAEIRSVKKGSDSTLQKTKKIIQELNNVDLDFVKEVTKISYEDLSNQVVLTVREELSRQKIKWSYLLASGLGLFLLGGAVSFYIVNYIAMGVK